MNQDPEVPFVEFHSADPVTQRALLDMSFRIGLGLMVVAVLVAIVGIVALIAA